MSAVSPVAPVVAVVGTGFIGPVHVEALRRLNIDVKGILGSSAERSRQAADRLGLRVGYASLDALLDDDEVTVLHLTSPNRHHFEQARRALEAGRHVICEKPLAMDAAQSAALVELARARPEQVAAVNYNIRFYPLIHHARALVASGALGEIYSVQGGYVQDWLLFDSDWNWRLEPAQGGALRAIGDIGTHWMDLIGFVTGRRVTRLLADLATFVEQRKRPRGSVETFGGAAGASAQEHDLVGVETEDYGAVLFRYSGGARGVMNVSQVSAGRKNRLAFEIAGSQAALAWDSERPNELWRGYRDRPNEILIKDPALLDPSARRYADYPGGHTEGFPDTFKALYRAVYAYLSEGDFNRPKPYPTFEDGHAEVVLCERILESHRHQRWVDVDAS